MDNSRVIFSMIWRFCERSSSQGISLLVTIVLARVLSPKDFGTIALITVFVNILQVFIDSGLGSALVQKKDADDIDFSTAFYFNCASCIVLYCVIYLLAPCIALFYNNEGLTNLLRVLSIILLISGVRSIQNAYIIRCLAFRLSFNSSVISLAVSAIVAVSMAYYGFGVWALVGQQIVANFVGMITIWFVIDWRPKMIFSRERFYFLFTYGSRLLLSSLLDTGYNNIRQLIIGRLYSVSDLAYYTQGEKYPITIVSNINASIDSVLFPVLSQAQDDLKHLRYMMRRAICVSSFLIWPLMVILATVAEPLVRLLMTEKWIDVVPYLQVFCFTYAMWPIHTANLNAIKAMGRSDIFLRLEIIKKVWGLCILGVTVFYGPFVMACGTVVSGIVSTIINSWPNQKILGYSYSEQWRDIAPGIIIAFLSGAMIYPIGNIGWSDLLTIIVQALLGFFLYGLLAYVFRLEVLRYLMQIFERIGMKKHKVV